jgi:hypothetical protein
MNSFQIGIMEKLAWTFDLNKYLKSDSFLPPRVAPVAPNSPGWNRKVPQTVTYNRKTVGDQEIETYTSAPKMNKAPAKPKSMSTGSGFQVTYRKQPRLTQQQLNEQGQRDLKYLRNFKPAINSNIAPPMIAPGKINTASLPYFEG